MILAKWKPKGTLVEMSQLFFQFLLTSLSCRTFSSLVLERSADINSLCLEELKGRKLYEDMSREREAEYQTGSALTCLPRRPVKESELFSMFLSNSLTFDGTHDLNSPSSLLIDKCYGVLVVQPNIL